MEGRVISTFDEAWSAFLDECAYFTHGSPTGNNLDDMKLAFEAAWETAARIEQRLRHPIAFLREIDGSYHACINGNPGSFPVYGEPK